MNNDMVKTIRQRRSIRVFTAQIPDKEAIEEILEAARWAPSGLNNQPWKFMVLEDEKIREGLSRFTAYKKIVRSAPISIVVCIDNDISYNRDKDLMAIGASIQNMLLCACSQGLGTCWLGEIINRKEEIKQYLKLESCLEIMAVIAIGYPGDNPEEGERRSLQEFLITGK